MAILIYGAYGYTGKLITAEAVDRKMDIIIAGRNDQKLADLAIDHPVESRVFDLTSVEAIQENIADVNLVLHCAGPFSQTAEPMMEACIQTGTHYLDITGEVEIFELAKELGGAASDAGIILMPGVGFDVVPTDCLSYKLKQQLPDADRLRLAFYSPGGLNSTGTRKTTVEAMKFGGYIREQGELKQVPLIYDTKEVTFNTGDEQLQRLTMTIPWGDVSTAYHTTGIPNIRVYVPVHPSRVKWLKLTRVIRPLLGWAPVQKIMKWRIDRGADGPSTETVEQGETYVWGQVCQSTDNGEDTCIEVDMITPNGYALTKDASLVIAAKILDDENDYEPGFHTPAGLFSDDLLADLDGIRFP